MRKAVGRGEYYSPSRLLVVENIIVWLRILQSFDAILVRRTYCDAESCCAARYWWRICGDPTGLDAVVG